MVSGSGHKELTKSLKYRGFFMLSMVTIKYKNKITLKKKNLKRRMLDDIQLRPDIKLRLNFKTLTCEFLHY